MSTSTPKQSSPGKAVALGILITILLGLRIVLSFSKHNDSQDFRPSDSDIAEQINVMMEKQREDELNRAMNTIRVAEQNGKTMLARWMEAQRNGLIGETGTLYVPCDRPYVVDGKPIEFGVATITPPQSGHYVVITRTELPDGRIDAKIVGKSVSQESNAR